MKITPIPPRDLLYRYTPVKDREPVSYKAQLERDQVEITSDAKTFSAALKAARDLMDAPRTNTERLEQIKEQINNNTYNVPGEKVAEKILGE